LTGGKNYSIFKDINPYPPFYAIGAEGGKDEINGMGRELPPRMVMN